MEDLSGNVYLTLKSKIWKYSQHIGSKNQMDGNRNSTFSKDDLGDILGVNDQYLRGIIENYGTFINIPLIGTDYYLNIINVKGDGNCGLYATLLGLYLKNPELYKDYVNGLEGTNYNRPNLLLRGELFQEINDNLSYEKKLNKNGSYFSNTHFSEEAAGLLNVNIKVIQAVGVKNSQNFNSFKDFYSLELYLDDIILFITTGVGAEHFKLILLKKEKLNIPLKIKMKEILKSDIKRTHNIKPESIDGLKNSELDNKIIIKLSQQMYKYKSLTNENKIKINRMYADLNINLREDNGGGGGGGGGSKGGSYFVYVSKIGRRKLRYTKKGRKYIINKGKRKYLK
jgi:hypothetical protein